MFYKGQKLCQRLHLSQRTKGCVSSLVKNVFIAGSGKSYLAKMLRDLEVEHGGSAPRIHSMDDYFMTEVEKVCFRLVPSCSANNVQFDLRSVVTCKQF